MHDDVAAASEFAELFPAVYLRFCVRRTRRDVRITPQTAAVLQHLAMAGPLTIGEMARHLDRAQSVVSEIVDALERKGLLERARDARDRRRVLVWLTEAAHDLMRRRRRVLDEALLASAMKSLAARERDGLIRGMRALVRAADGWNREKARTE